ncbi:MAG: hypothetical protein B6U76_09855 [Desulfurococcales archaeon ex4484_217_2]|nr:MAG: hypothetical protein B6U76_09855 [Desulfurococcales archaeon ex4484_217_2]
MSLERRILAFLKENPGANAREIAEALGVSYSRVQSALYRLREKGIIIKTGFGYAISSLKEPFTSYGEGFEEKRVSIASDKLMEVLRNFKKLEEKLNTLLAEYHRLDDDIKSVTERVNTLQKELESLKRKVNEVYEIMKTFHIRWKEKKNVLEDRLISELKREGVIDISIARNLALKSIEEYVRSGTVVVVSSLVVSKEFYEEFKKKFPIPKEQVRKLSEKEKMLLRALVDEGLAYLHRGIEYRLV